MIGVIGGGFVGGTLYGAADALAVIAADALPDVPVRHAVLLSIDAGLMGLIGAVAGAVAGLLFLRRSRAGGVMDTTPRWWGFPVGLASGLFFDVADRWFTRPPPFTEVHPLHGNPLVFLALAVLLAAAITALIRFARQGFPRLVTTLALTLGLVIHITMSERLLPQPGAAPSGAPDILLVTLDTTRADHMAVYAGRDIQTPAFDSLAVDGALMTNAVAQIPVTGPSHTTLLSGQGPWDHGGLLNGVPVRPDLPLMGEVLRRAGYRTGAFVSAYVLEAPVGLSRGFEVYDDDFGWLQGFARTTPGRLAAMAERHLNPVHVLERRGGRTVDAALTWMGQRDDATPIFTWVHLFDAHGPYAPAPPWDTAYYDGDPRDPAHTSMQSVDGVADYLLPTLEGITDVDWVLAQYAGEVSYADQQLGRLLEAVERSGRADNTLVVVLGDHGESLGEHGVWFNHGDDLFEPSMQVPMAMRLPGTIPAGTRVDHPVEVTDVAASIYELVRVDPPPSDRGMSMVPAMFGGPGRAFARSICFDRQANIRARERGEIKNPKWRMVSLRGASSRYVWRESPGYGEVFYDLSSEAGETRPADADPQLMSTLRGAASALAGGMNAEDVERAGSEIDPETRARLEAMGYME